MRLLISLFLLPFFVAQAQVYNFSKANLEQSSAQSSVYCTTEDLSGQLYIGTDGGGLNVYNGYEFKQFDDFSVGTSIRTLFTDSKGNVWVGSESNAVSVLNQGVIIARYSVKNGLLSNHIRSIVEAPDGLIWIGTIGGGVSILKSDTVVKSLSTTEGLPSLNCYALASDEQRVWIGTGKGLVVYERGEFKTMPQVGEQIVLDLCSDQYNRMWVGTEAGLYVLKNDELIQTFTTANGLKNNRVKSLLVNGNDLWIGTRAGLGKLDLSLPLNHPWKWFSEENGLAHNRVRSLSVDASGTLWIGTYLGLAKFFNESFYLLNKTNGLKDNLVNAVCWSPQDSVLWLGTNDQGVSILKAEKWTNISKATGLSENEVNTVLSVDSNRALVGTIEGLNLVSDQEVLKVWDA